VPLYADAHGRRDALVAAAPGPRWPLRGREEPRRGVRDACGGHAEAARAGHAGSFERVGEPLAGEERQYCMRAGRIESVKPDDSPMI
jgi:hypothetical protein